MIAFDVNFKVVSPFYLKRIFGGFRSKRLVFYPLENQRMWLFFTSLKEHNMVYKNREIRNSKLSTISSRKPSAVFPPNPSPFRKISKQGGEIPLSLCVRGGEQAK